MFMPFVTLFMIAICVPVSAEVRWDKIDELPDKYVSSYSVAANENLLVYPSVSIHASRALSSIASLYQAWNNYRTSEKDLRARSFARVNFSEVQMALEFGYIEAALPFIFDKKASLEQFKYVFGLALDKGQPSLSEFDWDNYHKSIESYEYWMKRFASLIAEISLPDVDPPHPQFSGAYASLAIRLERPLKLAMSRSREIIAEIQKKLQTNAAASEFTQHLVDLSRAFGQLDFYLQFTSDGLYEWNEMQKRFRDDSGRTLAKARFYLKEFFNSHIHQYEWSPEKFNAQDCVDMLKAIDAVQKILDSETIK